MNKQSGSAILVLLIAVGLFAALAYAFTQGSRTNTGMMTDEAAKAYATEIIQAGSSVQMAVKRLQLRGVDDKHISFYNEQDVTYGGTLNQRATSYPNCTTSSCQVFSAGGVTPPVAPKGSYSDPAVPSATALKAGLAAYENISVLGVGTADSEIVMRMIFLKKDVCMKINDILGIQNPNNAPPVESITGKVGYTNTSSHGTGIVGDEVPALSGKTAFCAFWPGAGQGAIEYHFYQVLIAR